MAASTLSSIHHDLSASTTEQIRTPAIGAEPTTLAAIYEEQTNIAIWKRRVPAAITESLHADDICKRDIKISMTVSPQMAPECVSDALATATHAPLVDDIAELVEMFCLLFDLKRAGLRLATLDSAMCPKFHVDRIPCRLVTTYWGAATQWLPHELVNHAKLGSGSNGCDDAESGLYRYPNSIRSLACGDVALLKGAAWEGNEHAGLVHRSPAVQAGERRLLLTLDLAG